jgi:glycine cleavage system aminomethyltransferase T
LGWAVNLDQGDFLGKQALMDLRQHDIRKKLCCMTMEKGIALGKEPIYHDGDYVGYVTSANYGYSIGKYMAYGYLPVELSQPGSQVRIEYFGERFEAQVDDDPLYDPGMKKLKI